MAVSAIGMPDTGSLRRAGPAPHLDADDILELRCAIERSLCESEMRGRGDGDIDAELGKSLRIVCMKARLQRVRAEQLLMDVKQLWATIPRMLVTRTNERLDEIITACIAEYYGKDP